MLEKEHPIVALDHPQKPRKARPPRNNLMISLKKGRSSQEKTENRLLPISVKRIKSKDRQY